ncbi:hypothetical protein [Nocardia sp. NPDC004722]
MAINVSTIRGYVLEELLARLLQDNGYRLLVTADQDRDALKDSGKGLLVRGRGTTHQVDVLGELDLPLPFSLPMRLFVEAKHRKKSTGIEYARNAYGTIRDVNEHFASQTTGPHQIPMKRYQYQYALFSASGFTSPAQEYALAQQISLVDLSGPGFESLLAAADGIATRIADLAAQIGAKSLRLKQIRHALRHALGTWPGNVIDEGFPDLAARISDLREPMVGRAFPDTVIGVATARERELAGLPELLRAVQPYAEDDEDESVESVRELPSDQLAAIVTELSGVVLDSFVLGFPSAPFILVLHVDRPEAFADYLDEQHNSEIQVLINHPRDRAENRPTSIDWEAVPVDDEAGFRLRFTLPAVLGKWMMDGNTPTWAVREAKNTLFSSIAIIRGTRVIRLFYRPHRG